MKLKFNGILVLIMVLITQITFAQDRFVTGVVTDNAGLPIPGVNVLVKGTTTGIQTDFDGKFKIAASTSDVLVFTFIGMVTQEVKASSTDLNVKMADTSVQLEGVVVTSLGIKREKKSLGYATEEVKAAELNVGAASGNFLNDLQGKAAGVKITKNNNFGGSTSVISRGVKSLTGDNQMLMVIDGVPLNNSNTNSLAQTTGRGGVYDYGNAAADINTDDIESINILKGGAASALYGYQAGNGVLIITTKKGKGKKGLGVSISTEFSVGSVDKDTFIDYQNQYGAGYGPYYGPDEDAYFNEADINGDGSQDLLVPFYEDASYGAAFDSSLMVYQWDAFTPYSPNFGKATPWKNAENGPITFFETPITSSTSISLGDSDDKGNYNISFNHLDQTGLLPNSQITKNNLSAQFTHNFSDKLTGSVFANFIQTGAIGRNSTGYNDNIMSNFRQWWQTNVDIKAQKDVYEKSGGQNITWNRKSATNGDPAYWDNPYFTRYQNYQNDTRDRFVGNIKIDYKINSWLSTFFRVSTDTYGEIQEERRAIGSVATEFGLTDPNNARIDQQSGYQRFNRNFRQDNYDLIFNFKKDINEDFSFNGLLGGTINRTYINTIIAATQGGLIVPEVYSTQNSVNAIRPIDGQTDSGINSYYGQVTFGYKSIVYIDGTLRHDAFSTLPAGDNTVLYPSISGSFVFSGLINQNWLNFGKLRANYAEVGNGAPTQSLVDIYGQFDPFAGSPMYSVYSPKNNPNLKPTTTSSEELGIEMAMFDRRLGFDVAVYKSLSTDQIFKVPYSNATGYSQAYVNAGSIQNKGIEVQLNGTPVKTKDFQWDIYVNWSKNENEVVSLEEGIDNLQLASYQQGVTINAEVGEPYGQIKGTSFTYLNGQKVVGADGRYVLNNDSNTVIGNVNPLWLGGLRNKFTYKNVSLQFLIDTQEGGDIYSLDQAYGQATGLNSITVGNNDLGYPKRNPTADGGGIILPGVQADGTTNTVRTPSPQYFGNNYGYRRQPNAAFVYDASYVKLREVNITYNFPSNWVERAHLQAMSFSIVGTNLWIISKDLPDADPESGLSSGNLSSGYSVGSLPTTRNIGANLTLKF